MNGLALLQKLAQNAPAPKPDLTIGQRFSQPGVRAEAWQLQTDPMQLRRTKPPVEKSDDLKRILALPRRPPVDLESLDAQELAREVTARYSNGATTCDCATALQRPCLKHLKPIQAWALDEMEKAGGLVGPIAVGGGKTLLDIMAPMAVADCKRAVLLVPPDLQDQLGEEYDAIRRHFRVPTLILHGKVRGSLIVGRPVLHVVPYSRFSRADATDMLEQLQPDLVIADEGQNLRNFTAARTVRVLRYFAAHPETRLCLWSGSLTDKSLKDYAHLSALALGEGSPVPIEPNVVEEWAHALDPLDVNAPPGALYELCRPGEHVRDGFRRRLTDTFGVVATTAGAIDIPLVIRQREAPKTPDAVKEALANVRVAWVRPDGEELVDILRVTECARQLSMGFYYHWRFPRGEPEDLIYDWFDARKDWHRELRQKLLQRKEYLDSPLLCAQAAIRAHSPEPYEGDLPVWKSETWVRWRDIRDAVKPKSEAVWIDDYLARDAAEWARSNKGLVWFADVAFGQKVAELAGLPCYDGGANSPRVADAMPDGTRRWNEDGSRSAVVSIARYATGFNGLQFRFSTQLVASPPANGKTWEQMLARAHRPGQTAPEVTCEVYRHTPEMADAIDKAVRQAKYIEATMGNYQKLLHATVEFPVR